MIKFITSRSGEGKSTEILNRVKENIIKNEKSMIIVKDQAYFNTEASLLKILGATMQEKVEVFSFNDLGRFIFNKLNIINKNIIDEIGMTMIIYKILEENKGNFKFFRGKLRERGFISSLLKLITEMKSHNIEIEKIEDVYVTVEDELLKYKLHDISLIYRSCISLTSDKYMDSQDKLELLYNLLHCYEDLKDYHIYIDEFSSFAPKQYKIIEKLAKISKSVSIALTSDGKNSDVPETDAFFVTKNTMNKLTDIAIKNNILIEYTHLKSKITRFKNKELSHLEKNFYSFPFNTYRKTTENIKIKISSNPFEEVEEVSKDILRNIREEGIRFKDIAIVTRDISEYQGIITALLSKYDIPAFLDMKKEIKSNKIIVFIKSALEIIFKNWNKDSVFRYLKTYLLDLSKEEIDILENYVISNGIKGKRKWMEEEWKYKLPFKSTDEEKMIERINAIKNKICHPFNILYTLTISDSTGKEVSKKLYEFLESSKVINTVEKLVDKYRDSGEQELANEYSQIWNLIVITLDQMVETLGETSMSFEEYTKLLSIGFDENRMGLIPPALDQVLVGEIGRTIIKDIKVLYIIGLNDGVFPRVINDEGLLNDNDREKLESMDLNLASSTKLKVFEEQFLIYETLTASSEKLVLSYPIADKEGRAKRPSMIISRIKLIFDNIFQESLASGIEDIERITTKTPTFNEMIEVIRDKIIGEKKTDLWNDAYKWFLDNEEFDDKRNRLLTGLYYTNQKDPIDKNKAKMLYGDKSSVSRLETYSKCPFNYFISYGLKIEERKVYGFNAMDKGSLFHHVIDRFSRKIFNKDYDLRNLKEEFYEDFIKEVISEVEREDNSILKSSNKYKYMTKRFESILYRTLKTIVSQVSKGDFKPISFEAEFDEKGEYKPIEIKINDNEIITIKGKIDRIDIIDIDKKIYVRIIDYKSGSKTIDLNEVYSGLTLQLLVYLDVILTSMEKSTGKNTSPAAVFYYKIDNPILKKDKKIKEEDLEKIIEENLKFKGYILKDKNVVSFMDRDIEENKKSTLIPVTLKKDGDFKDSKSLIKEEDFNTIRTFVRKKIEEITKEMFNGNIKVEPKKTKEITSCTYCKLSEVCGFDTLMEDNAYIKTLNLKDKEVIDMMKDKYINNGDKGI